LNLSKSAPHIRWLDKKLEEDGHWPWKLKTEDQLLYDYWKILYDYDDGSDVVFDEPVIGPGWQSTKREIFFLYALEYVVPMWLAGKRALLYMKKLPRSWFVFEVFRFYNKYIGRKVPPTIWKLFARRNGRYHEGK
jgi:hypothetical protein